MKTETKEVKLYIQAEKWHSSRDFEIKVRTIPFESDKYRTVVDLDTKVINIEIPALDEKVLVLAEIEQLQAVIKAAKAKHYIEITAMEEKINSLMCLENKVEE